MIPYLAEISEFASSLNYAELSPEVIRRAKFVLFDTIGVIAAGAHENEIAAMIRAINPAKGKATLLGLGHKVEPLNAALINGTAGTFLELDEGNQFCRGHAAIHVVPALLALAEEHELSGQEVIAALVAGYEIAARIGIAAKIRMSMHPHGTWGTVGAAVAVGRACRLNQEEMAELINISSSLGLATSRKTMLEGATVRNVYAGISNYMGLLALTLFKAGFTGEQDGLRTVYGSVISDSFDQTVMQEDLGRRFEITRNYFKMHACCRYNHSALDALLEIAAQFSDKRIPADNVDEVRVETYSLAAQLSDQSPGNMLAAKFSIPFAVSTCIVHGETGIDCFRPAKVDDSAIINLAKKVKVLEKKEYTAMMPERRPSRVTLLMKDGTTYTAETFLNNGDFEKPYSDTQIQEKFTQLASAVWGPSRSKEILTEFMRFETVENVCTITSKLGR